VNRSGASEIMTSMGTLFDDFPAPPSAKLLGWRLISLDTAAGRIELGFEGRPEFLNPMGIVQGGFLSAMLDDTMGAADLRHDAGPHVATTIDLHVHFLRPVKAGAITTKAQLTQLGRKVAFAEGQLFDADGRLSARGTCSASLLEFTMPPRR
jgi:uncharacterized protein (TIGR00369 family)